jgi:uncharacterized membrane protein
LNTPKVVNCPTYSDRRRPPARVQFSTETSVTVTKEIPPSTAPAPVMVMVGIMALGLLPILAPPFQLTSLTTGVSVAEYGERFATSPVPLALHIIGALTYTVLGALQFNPRLRLGRSRWHQTSGQIVYVAGLAVALSGLWMTLRFSWPPQDGIALFAVRVFFGTAMAALLILGIRAARRRNYRGHRAHMTRAYAIGIAAGTQILTTVPVALAVGPLSHDLRASLLGAGWVINLAVAEWIIRRSSVARRRLGSAVPSSVRAG